MRKLQSIQKLPFPAPDVVTKVVPVPTEGWDAISPLASMDPKRAPILDNWVPRPGWVELRQGFSPWNWLGSNSPVETLMVRRTVANADKMFAAMGSTIYDVTTLGTVTAVVTGLSSARFQYINYTPANGTTVIQCVNGIDALRMYDGTSWTTPSITGFPGGLNTTDITNIAAAKRRIWYVMSNGSGGGSTLACFMPTDAIMGPIGGSIDLGALWTKGGYLVAIGDWTVDGGNGPQDYVCFLSSRGQITIYQGTDPTSSTGWSIVGTFDIAPPISNRCLTRVGSDLGIISQQGVLPISQVLPFDPSADRSVAITARIQNAMAQASMTASNNFGWQLLTYPQQQLTILNVPISENSLQYQYVMNALTGAWCRFTGWNANCFEIVNDALYFGGNDGTVNLAYDGGLDLGSPIPANMQCAFNYFDDPGRTKRMTMAQPVMLASGTILPQISIDEDFATSTNASTVTILTGGALWDTAEWDIDKWPSVTNTTVNPWLSTQAIGHALAIHMVVNVSPQVSTNIGEFDIGVFDTAQFDQGVSGTAPTLQVNAFNTILELGGFL